MNFQTHLQRLNYTFIPVKSVEELNKDDYLLFIDSNGQTRGVDKVLEIKPDGSYKYLSEQGNVFDGSFKQFQKNYKFKPFKVGSEAKKYTDKNLQKAILHIENVFEDLFGENTGSFLRVKTIESAQKDFQFRRVFIEWVNYHEEELSRVRFQEIDGLKMQASALKNLHKVMIKNINDNLFNKRY